MDSDQETDIGTMHGTQPSKLSHLASKLGENTVNSMRGLTPSLWPIHKKKLQEEPVSTPESECSSYNATSNVATLGSVTPPSLRDIEAGEEKETEETEETESAECTMDDPVTARTSLMHIDASDASDTSSEMNSITVPCVKQFEVNSGYLAQLPEQRSKIVKQSTSSFSIIVAGESSMGKSTFIRTLLGPEYTENCTQTAKVPNKMTQVVQTTEIEVFHQLVTENGVDLELTVVDTPGFGNYIDNSCAWVPVVNYIEAQNLHYMCGEEQPDRSALKDTRVNACVYFLPPTSRVHALDLKAMREISLRTNLIPVIAKADSMTKPDLEAQQLTVRELLQSEGISYFSKEGYAPPFALVCSDKTTVSPANGEPVRAREYRWGIVDVDNPEHSDFNKVRQFIFVDHMLDLVESTDRVFYERYHHELCVLRLAKVLNYNEDDEAVAACEIEAESMPAIEILSQISNYGEKQVKKYLDDKDVLFKERVLAIRKQFDIVLKFQQERFDAQTHELEQIRERLNDEISTTSQENVALVQSIRELELQLRRK